MRTTAVMLVSLLLLGATTPGLALKVPKQPAESEMLLFWTPPKHQPHKAHAVDHYEISGREDLNWTHIKNVSSTTFMTMVPRGYDEYRVLAVWGAKSTPRMSTICVITFELDTLELVYNCEPLKAAPVAILA